MNDESDHLKLPLKGSFKKNCENRIGNNTVIVYVTEKYFWF